MGSNVETDDGVNSTEQSTIKTADDAPAVYYLQTKVAGKLATFEIESNRIYSVGRSSDCDITLDSAGVSRHHCKIQMESAEMLKVHDLESVNGVRLFLEGELQSKSSDIQILCGVKFMIGDVQCVWDRNKQGTSKKLLIALSIVLLLLLIASLAYFL